MDEMTPQQREIIMVSDIHLTSTQPPGRLDDAAKTCLRKFEWLLNCARQNRAVLITAGDMFDKPRDWYLLPEIARLLRDYSVTVLTVYGQHDSYMRSRENRPATTLGVLAKAGLVYILGSEPIYTPWLALQPSGPKWVEGQWEIYGAGWEEAVPTPAPSDNKKILVRHAPISTEPIYVDHQYIDAMQTLEQLKQFDIILCGDIHRSFHIQKGHRHILNTGPVFRYKADEYNMKIHSPSFIALDMFTGGVEWFEIPHEPAENVLTRDHIPQVDQTDIMIGFMDLLVRASMDKETRVVNIARAVQIALRNPDVPRDVADLMRDVMDTVAKRGM